MMMPHSMLNLFALLLGIYILLEGIHDLARYSGFNRICLIARDVFTALAGLMLIKYAWYSQIDWLHLGIAAPLGLYLWPKMVMRYRRFRGFPIGRLK
jgi:hypothetical protein